MTVTRGGSSSFVTDYTLSDDYFYALNILNLKFPRSSWWQHTIKSNIDLITQITIKWNNFVKLLK